VPARYLEGESLYGERGGGGPGIKATELCRFEVMGIPGSPCKKKTPGVLEKGLLNRDTRAGFEEKSSQEGNSRGMGAAGSQKKVQGSRP